MCSGGSPTKVPRSISSPPPPPPSPPSSVVVVSSPPAAPSSSSSSPPHAAATRPSARSRTRNLANNVRSRRLRTEWTSLGLSRNDAASLAETERQDHRRERKHDGDTHGDSVEVLLHHRG